MRLLQHSRRGVGREPIHRVLADLGELAELAERPGVHGERTVRSGFEKKPIEGQRFGLDRLGQMPAVMGLLFLHPAVLSEFPKGRKALVWAPSEKLRVGPCQVAHWHLQSREKRCENRRKNYLHHLPLGRETEMRPTPERRADFDYPN